MDYDDVVSKAKQAKAPEIDPACTGASDPSGSKPIVAVLKRVDARTRISIRMLQGVFVLMTALALAFALTLQETFVRAGCGLLAAAFVVVVILHQLRYRAYCAAYEGVPMLEYLQKARDRMRVFTVRTWLALPAWLLIDAALCLFLLAAEDRFEVPVIIPIAGLQLVLVLLVVLDFWVEHLIWRREHRPALGQINHLLAELLEAKPNQAGVSRESQGERG